MKKLWKKGKHRHQHAAIITDSVLCKTPWYLILTDGLEMDKNFCFLLWKKNIDFFFNFSPSPRHCPEIRPLNIDFCRCRCYCYYCCPLSSNSNMNQFMISDFFLLLLSDLFASSFLICICIFCCCISCLRIYYMTVCRSISVCVCLWVFFLILFFIIIINFKCR